MILYYISVGSNVGDRLNHLRYAAAALPAHGIRIFKRSSVYESAPWGNEKQEFFLNAMFLVGWEGLPEELLHTLQAIENERGRKRYAHWGPRTLDLDIIWGFDFLQGKPVKRQTKELTIPHPLYQDRAFVLMPLVELAQKFELEDDSSALDRLDELNASEDVRLFDKQW